jgi:hypothetical protein
LLQQEQLICAGKHDKFDSNHDEIDMILTTHFIDLPLMIWASHYQKWFLILSSCSPLKEYSDVNSEVDEFDDQLTTEQAIFSSINVFFWNLFFLNLSRPSYQTNQCGHFKLSTTFGSIVYLYFCTKAFPFFANYFPFIFR